MKKLQIIIIIFVIIVLIIVFDFFPSTKSVKSTDGVVELNIPQGAMPDNVTESDISITLISEIEQEQGVVGYQFKPDGLEFIKPVTISFISELDSGLDYDIPILIHQVGEGENSVMEIIKGAEVVIDLENQGLIVSGQINHFSNVWRVKGIFSGTPISEETEHMVGDEFVFAAEIKPSGRVIRIKDQFGYNEFRYAPGTTWSLRGKLTTFYKSTLSPHEQEFSPGQNLGENQSHVIQGDFKCEKKGDDKIRSGSGQAATIINYTLQEVRVNIWGGKEERYPPQNHLVDDYINIGQSQVCKEKEEKPTMMRICPISTVICEKGGKSATGYYECDQATGEPINNILLDLETGKPIELICP